MSKLTDVMNRKRKLEELEAAKESPVPPMAAAPAPPPKEPSYYKEAFHNVYNYTILAGGLAASALTLNPAPLLVALGVEGLWLSVGVELPFFKKAVEKKHAAQVQTYQQALLEARVQALPEGFRSEFGQLRALQAEILELWAKRPEDEKSLLQAELSQLDPLLESYLTLAHTWVEVQQHLNKSEYPLLKSKIEGQRNAVKMMGPGPARELAEKNVEISEQRLARMDKLKQQTQVARQQMTLMLNTLALMRDNMVSPDRLPTVGHRLDELMSGMEAAKEALASSERAEALMGGLG